jgi:CubicO group peptidase (beta-lactamase class C family)
MVDTTVRVDEARIDEIFRRVDGCNAPGAAVGVSVEGRPVYRKGFGLATMDMPVALSPSTRMRIYSITKHFTCLAYLLLCEDGKAALDDRIDKYLPELNPVCRCVTIRQLMSNTSGLWDVSDIRWSLGCGSGVLRLSDVTGLYRELDGCNFPPGTWWCYNNGGFQLLSVAIQRISGRSFGEFLRTRIFEPVGMYDTVVRPVDTDFMSNSAAMHMRGVAGRYERAYLPGELSGEGAIVSTVDDMLRWLTHMDRPIVGTARSWAALKTPVLLNGENSTGYGLGLFVRPYRGIETIGHAGGGLGASAQVLKVPAAKLDIVVIVNREDVKATEFAYQILDACLPCSGEASEGGEGEIVDGIFRSTRSGHVLRLHEDKGQQKVSVNWGFGHGFRRDKQGVLKSEPASILYPCNIRIIGSGNNVSGIEVENYGRVEAFEPVRFPISSDCKAIAGEYRNEAVKTAVEVAPEGSCALIQATGRFGRATYQLQLLGDNLWYFEAGARNLPWKGILSFDPAHRSFSWLTERTWSLEFLRTSG